MKVVLSEAAYDDLLAIGRETWRNGRQRVEAPEEIDAARLATKSDLTKAMADLQRWLIVTRIASAGFILAAMKFVK